MEIQHMSKKKQAVTSSFTEQYKDPRWQKKRLLILNRDEFSCQNCGDEDSTLHVHHKSYEWGLPLWDYDGELLITLCESCHGTAHQLNNQSKYALARVLSESNQETQAAINSVVLRMVDMNPAEAYDVLKYTRGK
jgi:Zn finger protein HypA/HybF involved in hydrogenase expression